MSHDCRSHKDYSQELPRFNRKRLESGLLINVNRINQNRLWLKRLIPIELLADKKKTEGRGITRMD